MRCILAVVSLLVLSCCGASGSESAQSVPVEATAAPTPPQPAPTIASPDVVARAYLEAGAREDEPAVRALLDPACAQDPAFLHVDAVRMMGAPITLTNVTVTPRDVTATSASVAYVVDGSVHSTGGTTTIFGATVHTGAVDMEGVHQSGTLLLGMRDGAWRVTCPTPAP